MKVSILTYHNLPPALKFQFRHKKFSTFLVINWPDKTVEAYTDTFVGDTPWVAKCIVKAYEEGKKVGANAGK